jgi:hypothetical protein
VERAQFELKGQYDLQETPVQEEEGQGKAKEKCKTSSLRVTEKLRGKEQAREDRQLSRMHLLQKTLTRIVNILEHQQDFREEAAGTARRSMSLM